MGTRAGLLGAGFLPRSGPVGLVVAAVVAACATGRPAGPETDVRMRIHFDQAVEVQFAVVKGDLVRVRELGARLAEPRSIPGLPPGAGTHLEAVREAALAVARAVDVEEAASASARLAGTCGRCHREFGVGLPFAAVPPPPAPGSDHMAEHVWAVDRLWEGVVLPSEARWQSGAVVLAAHEVPMTLLTPGTSQLGVQLKTLGLEASTDASPAARTLRLAEVVSTCAACHARSRAD